MTILENSEQWKQDFQQGLLKKNCTAALSYAAGTYQCLRYHYFYCRQLCLVCKKKYQLGHVRRRRDEYIY